MQLIGALITCTCTYYIDYVHVQMCSGKVIGIHVLVYIFMFMYMETVGLINHQLHNMQCMHVSELYIYLSMCHLRRRCLMSGPNTY